MQTHSTAPSTPTPASLSADATGSPAPGIHLSSYLLGLLTALILLGAMLLLWPRPQPAALQLQPPPTPAPSPSALPTAPPTVAPTPSPLVVFVSGAIARPGLYTLAPNARIGDAIAAAGGLLPNVDAALVNQAQPVVDGAQIHIPAPTPLAASAPAPALPAESSDGTQAETQAETQAGSDAPAVALPAQPDVAQQPPAGMSVPGVLALPTPTAVQAGPSALAGRTTGVDLSGGDSSGGDSSGGDSSAGSALINVNSASKNELESLPGIGPTKAQAIIDQRPYATVDELDRVPGIGPATLEQIRPYVTVGEG